MERAIKIAQDLGSELGENDYLIFLQGRLAARAPASDLATATALYFQALTVLGWAQTFGGSETRSVWWSYLDVLQGAPRKPRQFHSGGEIVEGFRDHSRTLAIESEILTLAEPAIARKIRAIKPLADRETYFFLLSDLGLERVVNKRLTSRDKSDPLRMRFTGARTIPGLLAGGFQSGGGGGSGGSSAPDQRSVWGGISVTVDRAAETIQLTPGLVFFVQDTVDFDPGDLGSALARTVTVPMSILEATGDRFGPTFAADVPLSVIFPGPGVPVLPKPMADEPRVLKGGAAKRKSNRSARQGAGE